MATAHEHGDKCDKVALAYLTWHEMLWYLPTFQTTLKTGTKKGAASFSPVHWHIRRSMAMIR